MKKELQWIDLQDVSKFCRIEEDFVSIYPEMDDSDITRYDIPLSRIKEPIQLVGWVMQLCEKSWIDSQRIEIFCGVVSRHYGWTPQPV
jgi:hypothetical protein